MRAGSARYNGPLSRKVMNYKTSTFEAKIIIFALRRPPTGGERETGVISLRMRECQDNIQTLNQQVVSQARPSRAERGSSEVPIYSRFVLAPTLNRVGVEC